MQCRICSMLDLDIVTSVQNFPAFQEETELRKIELVDFLNLLPGMWDNL